MDSFVLMAFVATLGTWFVTALGAATVVFFTSPRLKALDIPVDEEVTQTGYTDEVPQWLKPYLAAAVRSGLTDGLENQQVFGADTPITAAEADVLLKNALNREESCIAPEALPLTRAQAACALYDAAKEIQQQGIDEIL